MFTPDLRLYAIPGVGDVRVRINGSHVSVIRLSDLKVIYRRDSSTVGDAWYDASHVEIVKAIEQLTTAIIIAAVKG